MGRLKESFYRCAQETFTDRQWLMLLNSIVLFFSCAQIIMSLLFMNQFFHEIIATYGIEKDAYLGSWVALCSIEIACALAAMFGLCAAQKVSIDLLIGYFSVAVVIIAPMVLFTIASYQFQWLSRAWLRHRWNTALTVSVRKEFCDPYSSYDNECMGGPLLIPANWTSDITLTSNAGYPITADERGDTFDITEWCIWNYNSDECSAIYKDAIRDCVSYAKTNVQLISIASFINVLLLWICLNLTTSIITPAILVKYMSTKVNAMLSLPGAALLYIGLDLSGETLTQSSKDEVDFRQIQPDIVKLGKLYTATACILITLMMVGFNREMFRNRFWLNIYSACLLVSFVLLAVEGVWCVVLAADIEEKLTTEGWEGGSFACRAGLYGCSNCDYVQEDNAATAPVKCPEWSKLDIINYVRVYLTSAGLTAMTSMIYVFAAIFTSVNLSRKLREYRCEYV